MRDMSNALQRPLLGMSNTGYFYLSYNLNIRIIHGHCMQDGDKVIQSQPVEPKHQFVSDTIERMTKGQSLAAIDEHLNDTKGWYAKFNERGGITPGCWLHMRDKIKEYAENKDNVSDEISGILDSVNRIYQKLSDYERTREGNMVDNVNESGFLIEKLTKWCNSADRTLNDVPLMKTFLIVQQTMLQRSLSMSYAEKLAVKTMGLEEPSKEIQRKFAELGQAATEKIKTYEPTEETKTVEQYLSADLATLHEATFKSESKKATSIPFETMTSYLTEQSLAFNELHALRYMQDLFKSNSEKITGREYFATLIEGPDWMDEAYERDRCFNIILSGLGESQKEEWKARVVEANTLTHATTLLSALSVMAAPLLWASRLVAGNPFEKSELFETADSRNKKEFSALIEQRIDAVCSKIASNNTALKEGLRKATPERITDLKIKTELLAQLYLIDERLTAYIKENNTLSAKLGNWLRTYIGYKGPLGALVSEAKSYKNNIKELKEAVLADKPLNERHMDAKETVEKMPKAHAEYKVFVQKLREKQLQSSTEQEQDLASSPEINNP